MSYSYKQLADSDVELLKQLLTVFGGAFNDIDAYQGAVPNDAYLKALLSKPHFIVIVASSESEIVGGSPHTSSRILVGRWGRFTYTTLPSPKNTGEKALRQSSSTSSETWPNNGRLT